MKNTKYSYLLLAFQCFLLFNSNSSKGQGFPIETVIQKGHESPIKTIVYSKNGKLLASGSEDATAILWEVKSGRQLRTFAGHTKSVMGLSFHPNGLHLATASNDERIIIWDVMTGKKVKVIAFDRWVSAVEYSPNGQQILVSGGNNDVWIVDIETENIISKFHVDKPQDGARIRFSTDGKKIITGNDDGKIIIYNLDSQLAEDTLRNMTSSMCGGCPALIATNNQNHALLSWSRTGPVTLWNLQTNKITKTFGNNDERFHSVGLSATHIMASSEDEILIWNTSGKTINEIKLGNGQIMQATFSPDGQSICAIINDQTIRIYDVATGQLINKLCGYLNRDNERGLAFSQSSYWHSNINRYLAIRNQTIVSPDEQYIFKGQLDSLGFLVDLESGRVIRELRGHQKMIVTAIFHPDGQRIITASADRTIKIWNVKTGNVLQTLKGHTDMVFALALSQDGQKLASGSWDGTAMTWNLSTGAEINRYRFKDNSPYTLSFAHKDQYLLVGGLGQSFQLIELDSGEPARTFIGHTDVVTGLDINGDLIVSSGMDGRVKLWDIKTGLQELKFIGHSGAVHDVCFDQSGQRIATAGKDHMVKLWDVTMGKELMTFAGHEGAVTSVRFIYDNKYLVSGSVDGTTRYWDIESGIEIATHILFGKDEWLTRTHGGYFDATEGAKKNVFFVKGVESYSLDQFFEEFYKPGILKRSLSIGQIEAPSDDINRKLLQSPPPTIEIVSPKPNEQFRNDQIDVLVKVTNNGGGIEEIKLLHNGKRITIGDRAMLSVSQKGKSIYQHIPLQLIPGKNILSASAFSKERIESEIVQRVVNKEGNHPTITCHVVAIGIDKYKNPVLNLNYAKEDAEGFINIVAEKGKKLFNDIKLYPVYNHEATKENILKVLDKVAAVAKPHDVFFFYYAGHGSTVEGNFYFIPTDNIRLYDIGKLNHEAIIAQDIQIKFAKIAALKQLVILDACNSGSSTQVLASRGAEEEKALAQLSRSTGVHVLAASGSEQFAAEFKELGHGLFTYVLLEALSGKADGAPKDGKITIYELKSYIDDQVPEYSIKYKGQPQFPVTYSLGQDFPVVMDEEKGK